ncbi:hypothetical protein K1T71_012262 [Dendrolimus kikuchii]|uniref:Uncharacterized protein n=1 Tax=Dendrolimus kikuchii TaxID=765133 RepID=A0ACC1CL18_9NEOP|nr:hypothetical protein K1T71_012262 [Dendrolimus kikuchii]
MAPMMLYLFIVAPIILSANADRALDTKTLRSVFGVAQDYKPSGILPDASTQVVAVTPSNATLVDPDYWDVDDFAPAELNYDPFDWIFTTRVAMLSQGNFLLSPLGLKLALAILAEAATGPTQNEITSVLGLDLDRHVARAKFSRIIESLKKESPEYILNLGSRVYVGNNAVVRQRYAAIAQGFYKTEMKSANFHNPDAAAREINEWVNNVTQGRIPKLVTPDDVNGLVVMILNALYFKGTWRRQFATNETKDGIFYVSPDVQKPVQFMHVKDKFFFKDSAKFDAKILRMPYRGNKFAMYVIVPNAILGIPRILASLSDLRDELNTLDEYYVNVAIPKFKFEFTSHLEEIMRELGIRTVFGETASLPGIARGQSIGQTLKVSKITQVSGIELNELGSTVYSATEVGIINKFGEESDITHEFIANKQFIFFIQDESTRQVMTLIGDYPNTPHKSAPNNSISFTCLQTLESQIMGDASKAPNSRLNFFDIDLLRYTVEEKKGNVMVSPLTIRNILAMLLEGAGGNTAEEIKHSLRLSSMKEDQKNELMFYINGLHELTGSAEDVLENFHALFINKNLRIKKEYETIVNNGYKSEIMKVDFKSPIAVQFINNWVQKKTKEPIPALIQHNEIEPTAEVVIANTMYFKSPWKYTFQLRNNSFCFYNYNEACVKVSLMKLHAVVNYAYVPILRAHVVELPYQNERYSMILLVPENGNVVTSLIKDLPFMPLPQILDLMEPTEIRLSMPKFTVNYGADMTASLKHIGLKTLFEPIANLSGMFEGTTSHITAIYHKVYMDVDENGKYISLPSVIPLAYNGVKLKVDRPFLFFIRDNKLGIVFFEGKIENLVDSNNVPVEPQAQNYNPLPQLHIVRVAAEIPSNDTLSANSNDYSFDWNLTTRVAMLSQENFLLSPLGLKFTLAVIAEAAVGETMNEIISVLGFNSKSHVRAKLSHIIELLRRHFAGNVLNPGSIIYVNNSTVIRQRTTAIAHYFYGTGIESMNFSNPEIAARQINSDVNNITQGKISKLFAPDNINGLVILIVNAPYFGGTWQRQFSTYETTVGPFYVSPNLNKYVPFMRAKDKFFLSYSTKFDAKILRMPYEGKNFAMYVVSPNSLTGIPRIVTSLSDLRDEFYYLDEYIVEVTLPKFEFEYTSHLKEILKDLGMRTVFEDSASLPGIYRNSLTGQKLSKITQVSKIEINEFGTTVSSSIERGQVVNVGDKHREESDTPHKFIANRPFIFLIIDEAIKEVLFTGRVSDPLLQAGVLEF